MTTSESLQWLSQILWPDGSREINKSEVPGEPMPTEMWWASPSPTNARILIPSGSVAAAQTAVRRYHDGFDAKLRARSLVAESLMRLGPVTSLAMNRCEVKSVPTGTVTAKAPTAAHDGADGANLLEAIADSLPFSPVFFAIGLSQPKVNRKPVVQLLAEDGTCHGWAKIGWNSRTKALIGNEADWLQRRPLPPLIIPELVHDFEVGDSRIVISSSVSPSRRPARRRMAAPSLSTFRSVAAMGSLATKSVTDTAWWHSVDQALTEAGTGDADVIRSVPALLGNDVRVGAWHGDLTPWNLMTGRDQSCLIDWEFAADDVPLGFDLYHFHFQVASELRGLDPDTALDYSARLSPHGLTKIGVDGGACADVFLLYLVELVRRSLLLDREVDEIYEFEQGAAAMRRLQRLINTEATV